MTNVVRPGGARCTDCATRSLCIVGELGTQAASRVELHVVPRRFRRGEIVSEERAIATALRVVKVGSAQVTRQLADDKHQAVALIGRGAPISLLGYFGLANQTSVVASSAVQACDLPHETLRWVAREEPWIHRRLAEMAALAAGNLADWSAGLREIGTANRVARVLLLLQRAQGGSVVELPPQKDLAELLGIRRESVVRALAALQERGSARSLGRRRWWLASPPRD
jgi:CRP-like cAMP-binding protein